MNPVVQEFVRITLEAGPYLLLGYVLAGLLHVLMERFPRATELLARPDRRSVILASLVGVPMPLCSCSVLPAALSLRRKGASRGAVASFLISVPETDVVSILLTLAMLGPLMAAFRPLAALATAIAAGLTINWIESNRQLPDDAPDPGTGSTCCDRQNPESHAHAATARHWLVHALQYGFVEIFDDMVVQLLIGFGLAGALAAWLPVMPIELLSGSPLMYPVMLVIGVPVYVCATASTPLAAGMIAGGISPGAAMVFLLAGPATNLAGLLVLRKQFGGRLLAVYLAAIAVFSLLAGVWLDRLLGSGFTPRVVAGDGLHAVASPIKLLSAALMIGLTVASLRRKRVFARLVARVGARTGLRLAPRATAISLLSLGLLAYVASGLFTVGPGERGVTKVLGKVDRGYLPPGLHYHWPRPIGDRDVVSVAALHRVTIGFRDTVAASTAGTRAAGRSTPAWPMPPNAPLPPTPDVETTAMPELPVGAPDNAGSAQISELAGNAEGWMLTGDENIIDLECVIHYQVIDSPEAVTNFLYGVGDKEALLRSAAESALRAAVAVRDIDALLTVARPEIEARVRDDLLQPMLDSCHAGVRAVDVNLLAVHAPPRVHWAFRDVASAAEDRDKSINQARVYAERSIREARAEAVEAIAEASGLATQRVAVATGAAAAFELESAACRGAPRVTHARLRLEAIDRVLPGKDTYIDLLPPGARRPHFWLRRGGSTPIDQDELPWSEER